MKSHAAFQDGMPFFQAPRLKGTFCRRTVFYSTPASFYTPPDLFRRARCIPRPAPRPFRRRTRDGQAVIFVLPLLPKRPRGKTGKRQSGKACLSPRHGQCAARRHGQRTSLPAARIFGFFARPFCKKAESTAPQRPVQYCPRTRCAPRHPHSSQDTENPRRSRRKARRRGNFHHSGLYLRCCHVPLPFPPLCAPVTLPVVAADAPVPWLLLHHMAAPTCIGIE